MIAATKLVESVSQQGVRKFYFAYFDGQTRGISPGTPPMLSSVVCSETPSYWMRRRLAQAGKNHDGDK